MKFEIEFRKITLLDIFNIFMIIVIIIMILIIWVLLDIELNQSVGYEIRILRECCLD